MAACTGHRAPPPSTDIDEVGFRDAVRILASDDFEGRRPDTPGEEKTRNYLVDQFRKLGLKPGNGDSYLQEVPLVEIQTDGAPTLAISGRGAGRAFIYSKDMVIWSPRFQPEAFVAHSDMVFVGYGIVAPEYGWNDYAQTDVHGKTVVILVNDPGYGTRDPTVFRGNAETYYGRWTYKLEEAARQGAAGVLLIHDAGAAGSGWNALINERTVPQFYLDTADNDAAQPAIEGWLSADAVRALFAGAGFDFNAMTAAAARPGFKPVATGLKVDAAVRGTVKRVTSPNVIGVLPGARHKRECVIVSAHWDGLGRQVGPNGAILNGAVDDASGVAGLLMLAQSFVRTQPTADRSIVFIAFTGGESRLLGSAYYVEHPLFALRDTAGVLNLDELHIGGPTRDVMVFGYGNSELEDYWRDAALLQGRVTHPDPNPERGGYYSSDQYSFASSGVPALLAKAGIDDSARGPVWGQARLDDYLANLHDQPGDKYSPDWDLRGTLDDLRLYYEIGSRLARSRHYPRWYPNSEFRSKPHHPEGAAE